MATSTTTLLRSPTHTKRCRPTDEIAEVASPATVRAFKTAAHLPRSVVEAMARAGADVSHQFGLTVCHFSTRDAAVLQALDAFLATTDDAPQPQDPVLYVEGVARGSALEADVFHVLHRYRHLRADGLRAAAALPDLSGPRQPVPAARCVKFHHASIAGSLILSRLSDPQDAGSCPAITALPPGAFVCGVVQSWGRGLSQHIDVYRAE